MKSTRSLLLLILNLLITSLHANVTLPAIFGDNMVLQQGMVVPVWGKADPEEKVTVSVAGQSGAAVADAKGRWLVKLPKLKADGAPVTVTIKGNNTINLTNVLVGEIWLGSGQSNMQWGLWATNQAKEAVAAAMYPRLRLFTVKPVGRATPLDDVEGQWEECTPQTARLFSATLYYFGRHLQQQIDQPIGLINCSKGATIIQTWCPWELLMTDPQTARQVQDHVKQIDDPAWVAKKFAEDTAQYQAAEVKAKAEGKPVAMQKPNPSGGPDYLHRPAGLFNGMIHPLLGFALRGVVWYQGEFNKGDAEQYARLFPKMIVSWREGWGLGEFPFIFVQLPGNDAQQTEPCAVAQREKWAELREAQAKTLAMPNTAMAITIDTAPEGDLHPKNKQPVGERLARIAAHQVYGKEIACDSPTFERMTQQGGSLRIKFAHAEGGLVTKDGAPAQGFAIAGADKKFVWAEAKIEGDQVVLSSPLVANPVAVRYGWANNPLVSLFNQAGLPAAPFRTDDWK
jgi:sialate O-acetylesterase